MLEYHVPEKIFLSVYLKFINDLNYYHVAFGAKLIVLNVFITETFFFSQPLFLSLLVKYKRFFIHFFK